MASFDVLVVQFPHPGREAGPDRPGFRHWSLGEHRRKFMRSPGRWLTEPEDDEVEGELVFWGEWEPPSRVVELDRAGDGQPRFLHEPLWGHPPDTPRAQNTDPYVFGDCFLYSNCKQNTKRGKRRTQRLEAGSLILFGSYLGGEFVLDTVFVVADSEPLQEAVDDPGLDAVFRTVTAGLLLPREDHMTFRLYRGANSGARFGGMFSFVPCLPHEPDSPGFPRPVIQIDGVVNPRLKMGLKFTRMGSSDEVRSVWDQVMTQVLAQDLALGVHLAAPACHGGDDAMRSQLGRSESPGCT